jgi:hypothetical protein
MADEQQKSHHNCVVLYHYPCPDGVFSALAASLGLHTFHSSIKFIPHTVFASEEELERIKESLFPDDTLYFLDFSGRSILFDNAFVAER